MSGISTIWKENPLHVPGGGSVGVANDRRIKSDGPKNVSQVSPVCILVSGHVNSFTVVLSRYLIRF